MPLVNVMVNNRAYTIACDDGEEEHLKALAADVDAKVRELLGSVGQVGDPRLLLMAALLLADERQVAVSQLEAARHDIETEKSAHGEDTSRLEKSEGVAADALEAAASRLETLAAKLKAA
jgi:cell division protein ZapA